MRKNVKGEIEEKERKDGHDMTVIFIQIRRLGNKYIKLIGK